MTIMKKMSFQLQKMQDLGFLGKGGTALDLGCGEGNDTLALAELGYSVDAVDVKTEALAAKLHENSGGWNITLYEQSVADFPFGSNRYDIIIASNVLSFLENKEYSIKIIHRMADSMAVGGYMYFTLFGPKDEWVKNSKMSFFTYEEANNLIDLLRLHCVYRSTEEGLGKMMNGNIKYWHIHRFLLEKQVSQAKSFCSS